MIQEVRSDIEQLKLMIKKWSSINEFLFTIDSMQQRKKFFFVN